MIRIYDASYTANQHLNSNGLKILQPQKCIETKGEDEWKLEVEIDDSYADFIEQNNVIVVKTKEGLFQPFRIGNVKLEKHVYSFEAKHVFFDLENYMVEDITLTNQSGPAFIAGILSHTTPSNSFTGLSDILTAKSGSFVRKSVAEAIFEARYLFGGHLRLDNFNIYINSTIGANRGVEIREGKNLEGLTKTEVWDNVVTKLIPTCGDRVYDALNADVQYDVPYVKTVSFESDYETEAEIESDVIAQATAYLNENKYPKVNYIVKSDIVQNVQIGDTIKVISTYDLNTQVLAYKYNVITERILSVEFGNFQPTVKNVFKSLASVSDVQSVKAEANQLIIDQTNIINGLYKYGYVVVNDNEIYVVDTLPKEDATYVLRINLGGIGFSSTGINGTYSSAWTLDGKFNANFIQTGTINVGLINGSALDISANTSITSKVSTTDYNGNTIASLINQTSTTISIEASKININGAVSANTYFKINTDGTMEAKAGKIGSWNISTDRLYAGSGTSYVGVAPGLSSAGKNYAFWAGNATPGSAKFSVETNGAMKAVSGNIGGFSISSGDISVGIYNDTGYMSIDSADKKIYFWHTGYYIGFDTSYGAGYSGVRVGGAFLSPIIYSPFIAPMQGASTSYLGNTTYRWNTIYQTSGTVTGSDARLKDNIQPITNGVDLILNLKPVEYKMKDGNRRHYGFIAQDVQRVMVDKNIGDVGLLIDPMVKPDWDVDNPDENNKEHYMALRYEEFIAPMVQTLQSLNERLSALENR